MNEMNKVFEQGDLLLNVKGLSIGFGRPVVEVVDKVNFKIHAGEVFSLVGESGCGKSVTASALLRLLPTPGASVLSGEILWKNQDVLKLNYKKLSQLRGGEISMIFQDPGAALNPVIRLGEQLRECFAYNRDLIFGDKKSKTEIEERIDQMLLRVGFGQPKRIKEAYAHELSGGMLQRVMIAMALLPQPKMIIADEPTTALDVTVQAQVMELLVELAHEMQVAVFLITHNLNLVAQYSDNVAVMYAGRIIEEAPVDVLLNKPLHPYTIGLLNALPKMDGSVDDLVPIDGQVPQPKDFVKGCRFKDRCPRAMYKCDEKPDFLEIKNENKDEKECNASKFIGSHRVACFAVEDR